MSTTTPEITVTGTGTDADNRHSMRMGSSSFTVEVPPANLIYAEILAVTSAMRKNQRWATASYGAFPFVPSAADGRVGSSAAGVLSTGMANARGMDLVKGGKHVQSPGGLMSGFMALKMELRQIQDISKVDALVLLHPFLEVVRSPETSGPITATALSSIDRFITYSILHPHSPNLELAMAQLSTAGTHCKFEASDSVSDEVVLLKILDVLRNCLTGPLGAVLSDESVCEMMETGLSMCCQMRLSEMLRRSAERTMQTMVAALFTRLRTLPSEKDLTVHTLSSAVSLNTTYEHERDETVDGVRMSAPDPRGAHIPAAGAEILSPQQPAYTPEKHQSDDTAAGEDDNEDLEEVDEDIHPFGLASIQELLRVLISLLNPHDQQHTDSMRLMSLGLLNIAFEVGGASIGKFSALRAMVGDHLCKHLFQLARSDNPQLLSTSLRVICNIFDTMRAHLKLQQELFLSFLLDRLILPTAGVSSVSAPGARKAEYEHQLDMATWASPALDALALNGNSSTLASGLNSREARDREAREREMLRERERDRGTNGSIETRELMLEILGQAARGQWAIVDFWVNYDCNVEGEDLFERLIKFLSRGVFPSSAGVSYIQDNTQLLCLDTILEMISHMAARANDDPAEPIDGPTAEQAAETKSKKQILLQSAAEFNLKPKVGLKFLEDHGIIGADPKMTKEESLARFFKTTPKLDKKLLGDFISRPDQLDVLKAFMRLMDFDGKIICDAMRELLEAFRLPGESQQIARITETFAEVYFETKPPEVKSQDAVYVLAYSVIMLNTDLHNPQVRKRMDIAAYSRNLRGVNDGSDFAPEYLQSIYDSIRKREIVLPEEHQNQVGFEYGWKELLRRTRQSGPFTSNRSNVFDRGMFAVLWRPIVSAMSYAFANFQDDYMVQRSIAGFNECAALAARFDRPEVFDYLILSLSRVTGLALPSPTSADVGNFPVVEVEPGQSVTVSPLAVKFGTNVKAQLAAVVLFTIANNNGASIREGWLHIFEIMQTLFVHSLLPTSLLAMEEFLSSIPLKPKSAPAPREDRRSDGGLLSALSSYLLSPYGNNETQGNDYTEDDVETTLSAVDTIASCRIEQLYSQILELKGDALMAPVQVLIELIQRLTVDRLRTKSGSAAGSAPSTPQISISTARVQLSYDPSAILLLEILTSVVARSGDSILDLWPPSYDLLSRLLSSASSFSSLFNERVVASLLRLISHVIKHDELRDSTFLALDILRSLPPPVLSSVAEPLMAGLSKLFLEHADRIESTTEWNLIFALFQVTIQQEEAAKISFELMRRLAAGKKDDKAKLGPNNYSPFLHVLVNFANVNVAAQNSSSDLVSEDPAMQRGRQIVDILKSTQEALPQLIAESNLSATRAWEASWIPLLSAYSQLCLNSSRELRQIAISSLQRTLVAREILDNPNVDFTAIFEKVFFPMLEELLKPQVFRRDPEGMGETRLRASALSCKIFLSYLTQLSERQGMETMTQLWLRILGYQDRFMHSGRRDQMFEAVPESLKNVILVMNEAGFLRPPHDPLRTPDHAPLWDATFERIQPFLPELKNELFPPPKVKIPVPFENVQPPRPTPPPETNPARSSTESQANGNTRMI